MRLPQRRIREVYRVYREGEVPEHEEWSQPEQPTRVESGRGQRTRTLHRVLVMTLLGAGVGVVAALALHSMSGFMAGKEGGARLGPGPGGIPIGAGPRGVASLANPAPRGPVASVPATTPAQPTISAPRRLPAVRREAVAHRLGHGVAHLLERRTTTHPFVSAAAESPVSPVAEPSSLAAAQVVERPAPAGHTSEFGFEG